MLTKFCVPLQVVRKLVTEKSKQLEEKYNETIIPELAKKISLLESENRFLQEHAKKLQEQLGKIVKEYQKREQVCKKLFVAKDTECISMLKIISVYHDWSSLLLF